MTNATILDRDMRQRAILPPEALAQISASVVGVGAIGHQVALQLAAVGVASLQLIDFDTVEAVNLAPQGYLEEDLGKLKVQATAEMCGKLNSQVKMLQWPKRFQRSDKELGNVVFDCVDSIETRRLIWEAVKDRTRLYVDARMSAEVLRVLTVADAAGRKHYPTTLFAEAQAFRGACTAKATIYCANIAAGLMVSQFAKWLRKLPVDADVTLNLLAGEWTVATVGGLTLNSPPSNDISFEETRMKNVLSQSSRAPIRVLFKGSDPSVPTTFSPTTGVLLWRGEHKVVMVWDPDCMEFVPLGVEQWYAKHREQFPLCLPVDQWAIVAPLTSTAVEGHNFANLIDHDTLNWAFRDISPVGSESFLSVSDQLQVEDEILPDLTLAE